MRTIRSRSAACVAGLAYLLAAALSGLLHNHEHDSHSHVVAVSNAHSDGLSVCDDSHERLGHDSGPSAPEPESDDDCLACRFVTQCAVVTVPLADVAPRPIVAEVRVSAPRFFIEPVYSSALARAPPLG